MTVDIRYVSEKDDPYEISRIYEQSWKYAYKGIIPQDYLDSIPEGRWANNVNKPGMNSLVLSVDEKLVGTASFCRSRWERYHASGEIVSIYFLPEYIGRGFGTLLLNKCREELYDRGYDSIILWVLEENKSARSFYEKNGFVFSGEYLDDNIGGKDLREVMYICDNNQYF